MKNFIGILIITSFSYTADLNIRIKPDTIYVGSLVTINVSVTNMESGEFPVFHDIAEQPNIYTIVERLLHDHSSDYTLQFWESGLISIPSILVEIKKYNQNVAKLESDIIEISILSSMNDYSGTTRDALRDIKPMQKVKLMSTYKVFLYTLLLIMGILLAIILWNIRKENQVLYDHEGDYNKSIFQETIRSLKSLQIPNNINRLNTEKYYLELSHIFRNFIKEEYFIRATEMTSDELEIYFQSIGIPHEIIQTCSQKNKITDMGKYAGNIPRIDQFKKDRDDFINIIKSLQKTAPHISL